MLAINHERSTLQECSLLSPTVIPECLDLQDCGRALKLVEELVLKETSIENYLRFKMVPVPYEDNTAWLYGLLYDLAKVANEETYFFDPLDMVENIFYCEFDKDDYHSWHTDISHPRPFIGRKMGLVVNLSASDEYRGGDLLFNNGNILNVPRSKGTAIFYPGFLLNETQPVTKGKRKILVAWFGGSNLK